MAPNKPVYKNNPWNQWSIPRTTTVGDDKFTFKASPTGNGPSRMVTIALTKTSLSTKSSETKSAKVEQQAWFTFDQGFRAWLAGVLKDPSGKHEPCVGELKGRSFISQGGRSSMTDGKILLAKLAMTIAPSGEICFAAVFGAVKAQFSFDDTGDMRKQHIDFYAGKENAGLTKTTALAALGWLDAINAHIVHGITAMWEDAPNDSGLKSDRPSAGSARRVPEDLDDDIPF